MYQVGEITKAKQRSKTGAAWLREICAVKRRKTAEGHLENGREKYM